jgi:hypothetical protein
VTSGTESKYGGVGAGCCEVKRRKWEAKKDGGLDGRHLYSQVNAGKQRVQLARTRHPVSNGARNFFGDVGRAFLLPGERA